MSSPVRYEVVGPQARITLDRPEARNALDGPSLVALAEGLAEAAADRRVRLVVLGATGPVFCAGADLAGASGAEGGSFASSGPAVLAGVLEAMISLAKPVITRVQGHVVGGGIGLVAASDLSVAVEGATFAFGEVRVGVAPAVISVAVLRRMSPAAASELMVTGARVGARRVLDAGLLTRVVTDDELDATVDEWTTQISAGGPTAVAATKALLDRVPGMTRPEAWEWTARLSGRMFTAAEAQEGMGAFLARRPADWSRFADVDLDVLPDVGPDVSS